MAAKRRCNNRMKQIHENWNNRSDTDERPKLQDSYCWLCHQNNTNVGCSTCIRSYHYECIGQRSKMLHYQCESCIRLNLANSCTVGKFANVEYLNRLLIFTTKRSLDDQEFIGFNRNFYKNHQMKIDSGCIVNPIDLDRISVKVHHSEYKSTIDFLYDIKWLCHNVNILDRENKNCLRIAKRLETYCWREIYDIEMCHQCYYKSNSQTNWFTSVCDPPHLLVWARVNGHSHYAPAKVLGLNGGVGAASKIDVRFFGDHEMASIPSFNCFLFSKRKPLKKSDELSQPKLSAANRETKIYIGNIRNKYKGDFIPAEYRTQFNDRKIVKYLTAMIPGICISKDFQLVSKPSYLNRLFRRHASIKLPTNIDHDLPNICSSSNVEQRKTARKKPTLKPPSLSPMIIIEKCDSLLTRQQKNFNRQHSMDGGTADVPNQDVNQEANTDKFTRTVPMNEEDEIPRRNTDVVPIIENRHKRSSNKTNENRTLNDQNNDGNGQDFVIMQKNNGLSQKLGPRSTKLLNKQMTSSPMQPIDFQGSELRCNRSHNGHVETSTTVQSALNRVSQISGPMVINDIQQDNDMRLTLATVPDTSEGIATNSDWEKLLDKYRNVIIKRHRVKRKIVQKREKSQLMRINQLKSMVNVLKKRNHKLEISERKLRMQQNDRIDSMLQNAVEETKCKKWCWNCHIELKLTVTNIPFCKDCFNRNWFEQGENLIEPTPENGTANIENTNEAQNLVFVEQITVNDGDRQQFHTVNQLLADLNGDDPLSLELEGC